MNGYIYTYVHLYTYLHLFLYICVCTDFNKSTNLYCSLCFVFIQQSDIKSQDSPWCLSKPIQSHLCIGGKTRERKCFP